MNRYFESPTVSSRTTLPPADGKISPTLAPATAALTDMPTDPGGTVGLVLSDMSSSSPEAAGPGAVTGTRAMGLATRNVKVIRPSRLQLPKSSLRLPRPDPFPNHAEFLLRSPSISAPSAR